MRFSFNVKQMNKNIYCYALQAVKNGARYRVDFEKRSLKVNGKYLIKDGKYEGSLGVFCYEKDALSWLERKYQIYKHSVPREADRWRKAYFKALEEKDLDDEDMLYGEGRRYAQCDLELLFLCLTISGTLKWSEERMGKWFWQSEEDKDFVVFRKWIEFTNK